jgi:hypothetical protein
MSDAWFGVPSGRRLDEGTLGSTFEVHVLPKADKASLRVAERAWGPPAKSSDFNEGRGGEWTGKDGTRYLRIRGNPLAGYDQATPIAAWFEQERHLIFLREADAPDQVTTQILGIVGARAAAPDESQVTPIEQVLAQNAIRGGRA